MMRLLDVRKAVSEILQHPPANFRILDTSKRNSTFVFSHDQKTWILKIYGTPEYEMKSQKEAFFWKHIYPLLYPDVQSMMLYSGPSALLNGRYIIIREFLDAKPIDSVDKNTLMELVNTLKLIHQSSEIRVAIQGSIGFQFNDFGEIMGTTEGIRNTPDIEQYFSQAHDHWFANIQRSGYGKHEIKIATGLQEIMNDRLATMPTKPALTHADVKVGNLMRLKYPKRLMVIDFENAFSFFPEYDFVTLMFAREVDRLSKTIPYQLSYDKSVNILLEHYYQNSISRTTLQARIQFLTCYAYLRLWNFAIRIEQPTLANEVILFADNFIQKFL